ncbi:TM2 domain-containing protein [Facklamia sp. P13064]|uniref:TM2 domain-containing protein n=1 Tax=Facklamia sp. P13064 TaxID=3421953 RepID=UPI003D178B2F
MEYLVFIAILTIIFVFRKNNSSKNHSHEVHHIVVEHAENPGMYYNNGRKKVNKVLYLIIIFFLGAIGIHKFYIGDNFKGFMYLLFSWTFIPAILALFSFFGALFKRPDRNGDILV